MTKWLLVVSLALCGHTTMGLDNGLALSPPMGWITTERFECNVDCVNYPDDCISENLVKSTVDAMVTQGLPKSGYKYVILGDCWMNKSWSQGGHLQPDSKRFPGGMKVLSDYIHQKGLYFGLQVELGNKSTNGYPGCAKNYNNNAATFAAWGVDYIKATAFSIESDNIATAYKSLGSALNKTGRHMVYDCNWPAELKSKGRQVDYKAVSSVCNMYETNTPMVDSWESLEKALKFFGKQGADVYNNSGPGHWNTPNMVLVGDFGLSNSQQRLQMAVWCMMPAPLLVSADLRHLDSRQRMLLTNKGTLAVDQDPLHLVGTEINILGQVHIWRKRVLPAGSFALLFMYFNVSGGPTRVSVVLEHLGIQGAESYQFFDVFSGQKLGIYKPWYTFNCQVDPVGAVFIKAVPLPPSVIQG